jgi:hypothetical protein
MVRILPDQYDGYVWLLNETSGNYKNTGFVLPNHPSTDLTISGTVIRNGTGIFDNCPYFPGIGNYPTGASSSRNYIFGAETINPQPPFTISAWVNLRNYNSSNNTNLIGKLFRKHTTTNNWANPYWAVQMTCASTNGGGDLYFATTNSVTSQNGRTIIDFPLPLHQWCHIGMTHDGSTLKTYLNGCQLMTYSGSTQQLSLPVDGYVPYQDLTYTITSTTGTYIPGVTDIGNHGNEVMTNITLPFPVIIYGRQFSNVNVSSNGFLEFGQTTQANNFTLPNGSLGITVCVFQRDEDTTNNPFGIFTDTIGSVGNRTFIIEWRNQPAGGGGTLNYEIKFIENSTTFETLYTTSTSTATGCIGIQSAAGSISTVFSNSTTIPSAGTRLIFSPSAVSSPGAWVMGATPPYLVTSSTTKEEANYSIQDVRIANIVRPPSYFQAIYKFGALPAKASNGILYYKLRAFDLSCVTPTPVTWIDTEISLTNAPIFPCSGPYSNIEVLDAWIA